MLVPILRLPRHPLPQVSVMPDYRQFDRPDDELDDSEFPEEDADADESYTVRCPRCGSQIYEDVDRCPYCGQDVATATTSWSGRPWWWIVLGLLGAAVLIWALIGHP